MLLNLIALPLLWYIHDINWIMVIKWAGLTFLSSLPFSVIFWILTADEDFEKILWLRMVNSGSTILSFATLILMHRLTLQNAFLFNFLTNCVTSIAGIAWGVSRLGTFRYYSKMCMKEISHFGKYSLATGVSSTFLRSADFYILNAMLGPVALAIYSIPVRLMEIVEIPLRTFVTTGMTNMAAAYNKGNLAHVTHVLKKYSGMLVFAFIPVTISVLLFAELPIYLLGAKKFLNTEAPNIYRLLMCIAILYPIDRFNGITLDIMHQPKINFYKVLVMLAVNIPSDIIAVRITGNVYGVVIGVLLTCLSGIIFGYIQLNKFLPYTIPAILATGFSETKLWVGSFINRKR